MWSNISVLIQAPVFNAQLILDGLLIGAVFALAAYGLALVWGVMNVKNLCQGDYVIMGGYMAFMLPPITSFPAPLSTNPILAVVVLMVFSFAIMFVAGWVVYLAIIRRVVDRDMFTSLLATFGLAIVIQQGLNIAFGPDVQIVDSGMGQLALFDGQVILPQIKVASLFMCAALAGAVVLFMKHSRMGQAIRATAQDARAARVMGINTDRVYAFTYALNAAICGAAGVLIAMIWVIQPFYGIPHSIRAFVIVTAAGLANLPGVIITAFGLGVAEQYAGFVLGAEFQQATVVLLLILVLIWRQIQMGRQRMVVQ